MRRGFYRRQRSWPAAVPLTPSKRSASRVCHTLARHDIARVRAVGWTGSLARWTQLLPWPRRRSSVRSGLVEAGR